MWRGDCKLVIITLHCAVHKQQTGTHKQQTGTHKKNSQTQMDAFRSKLAYMCTHLIITHTHTYTHANRFRLVFRCFLSLLSCVTHARWCVNHSLCSADGPWRTNVVTHWLEWRSLVGGCPHIMIQFTIAIGLLFEVCVYFWVSDWCLPPDCGFSRAVGWVAAYWLLYPRSRKCHMISWA